jgi:uncharacterized membrane protein YphA (DoxX/SURF4 family)
MECTEPTNTEPQWLSPRVSGMSRLQSYTRWLLRGGLAVGTLVAASGSALAHVEYVTNETSGNIDPVEFVVSVLANPMNAGLVGIGGMMTGGALAGYLYLYESAPYDIYVLRETLTEDADFLPWLLRLSIGLPLVGAGFAGYFISPAVEVANTSLLGLVSRLFLTTVGFFLLYGIATRIVAIVGLAAYVVVVFFAPELLLASEYLGGFLAIVVLGSGRPSASQLLYRLAETDGTLYGRDNPIHRITVGLDRRISPYKPYTPTILRLGLGINFVYTGLFDKLLQPGVALAVVEKYHLTAVVPVAPGMWVVGAGATELLLGCALVVGIFTRGVATVAFGVFTLTLFALPNDPVLAHISLFGMATALLITGSGRIALDNL